MTSPVSRSEKKEMPSDNELRALNAEVAERIFGWRLVHWVWEDGSWARNSAFPPEHDVVLTEHYPYANPGWVADDVAPDVQFLAATLDQRSIEMPDYSGDIGAAFLVVAKMRADGWRFELMASEANPESETGFAFGDACCRAEFARYAFRRFRVEMVEGYARNAMTPTLAICRAALDALKAASTSPRAVKESSSSSGSEGA